APYLPLRGIMAARERWWPLLARLANRHDMTLLAFVDPEDEGRECELPPGLAAVHVVPKRAFRPDDPLALLPKTVAGGYCDPAFRAAVAARLAAEPWDVVQYEFTEMAHCIPGPAPRSVLTVHQIGFAQEAPAWRAGPRTLRRGAVLLHRYLRELDFELRALSRVDHVVTMSAEDAARLHRFAPDVPISVSPCGVDCHAFRPPDPPPRPPRRRRPPTPCSSATSVTRRTATRWASSFTTSFPVSVVRSACGSSDAGPYLRSLPRSTSPARSRTSAHISPPHASS